MKTLKATSWESLMDTHWERPTGFLLGLTNGDFKGKKLRIFDGHTLGEANRDLLGITDGDFKGSISHQDAVETLSSSCMLD